MGVSQNFVLQIFLHAAAGQSCAEETIPRVTQPRLRPRRDAKAAYICKWLYGVLANYPRRKWDLKSRSVTS